MTAQRSCVLGIAALVIATPALAAEGTADEGTVPPPSERTTARDVAGTGLFLSGLEPARASAVAGSGLGVAGVDGARHAPFFSASAEVALTRWLVLRGGVIYRSTDGDANDGRSGARPAVSLRASVLDQKTAGVDVAVSVGYSQEKLATEGGMLHVGAAVGHSFDRLSLIGNASVGSDPAEGDDRDGILGGAFLYRTLPSLQLGAQGFFRRDLGSTDARRLLRKDGQYDFAVGPVASYARDVMVFTVQTGVSGVKGATSSGFGVLALGGVGAVF